MVIIENLNFAYAKDAPIFQDFNWHISSGERWSIIGPSGCGKTTLLYLLAGLRSPASGKISFQSNGKKPSVGLILQDYGLLPWINAIDNVSLALKIQGMKKETVRQIAAGWMARLGLDSVSRNYPAELSGGQRQRVAIARTLTLEPSLLLMDEPFASLDTLTRESLLDLILDLWARKQPSTMVLVTHNIEEAVYWGTRILVLNSSSNIRPLIIENPRAGSSGYRSSADFLSICQQLRGTLAKVTVARPTGELIS